MHIRKAIPSDIKSINYCIEKSYSKYISRIGKKPDSMNTDFLPLIKDDLVRVLEINGKIIGVVVLIIKQNSLEIRSLAVLPHFQKMGFGKKLLEYSEKYASQHGIRKISLYTNSALPELIQYYKKQGYIEEKRKRKLENGFYRIYLTKKLPTDH